MGKFLKMQVNTQSIKDSERAIRDAFNKVIKNQKMLGSIGDIVVTDIKYNTRLGVDREGKQFNNLKTNKPTDWGLRREQLAPYNNTHQAYKGGFRETIKPSDKGKIAKSNLTFTGQLMDNLSYIIENAKLIILFKGEHKPYRSESGTRGKITENAKIADGNIKRGRNMLGVNDKTKKKVNKVVVEFIRRSARALGLVR